MIRSASFRPIVLTFLPHYLPGYKSGGPVRTLANLVDRLGGEFDFKIVTSDRDAKEKAPYAGVEVDVWTEVGKARVFYASERARRVHSLVALIRNTRHDVFYLNSFFSLEFAVIPLIARRIARCSSVPCVIAPRGQFAPSAMDLKRWKKLVFLAVVRSIGLYKDVYWQASSQAEVLDVRSALGPEAERIFEAGAIPLSRLFVSARCSEPWMPERPLKVCFLSRISPTKNLDFLLEALRVVTMPMDVSIYGMVDDVRYWSRCRELLRGLPRHVRPTYHGPVPYEEVASILATHDIFVLPTRGESYGHAIIEALASGVPVLISDRTPWRDIDTRSAGWILPLEEPWLWGQQLDEVALKRPGDWVRYRRGALTYANEVLNSGEALHRNRDLFRRTAARSDSRSPKTDLC